MSQRTSEGDLSCRESNIKETLNSTPQWLPHVSRASDITVAMTEAFFPYAGVLADALGTLQCHSPFPKTPPMLSDWHAQKIPSSTRFSNISGVDERKCHPQI